MLKIISRLFLGLVVCAGSVCVTPTHASSADEPDGVGDIIITRIQATGVFGAKDEYFVLHNNSGIQVDITNWCLMNEDDTLFACFASRTTETVDLFFVPPYGDVVVASSHHSATNGYFYSTYTRIYDVTNQSSGSIVNSGDNIVLINNDGRIMDAKEWSSAIPTGKIVLRVLLLSGPDIYANTHSASDWIITNRVPLPSSSVIRVTIPNPDLEPQPEPEDESAPEENIFLPIITEILANPSGSDTGSEFIELYNPNEHRPVLLDQFTLLVGSNPAKSYSFPAGAAIPPLSYIAISNQEMEYTLVNTTGKVQLAKDGVGVGETIEYLSPKDEYAWALIDGVWQYTKQATPGSSNSLVIVVDDESDDTSEISSPKPCAANQFRNPETGRCKLTGTVSSTPTPCKENQERNPETNRCRNIATADSPAPCKEGQERSLETNRCRAIVKMSKAGNPVSTQTKADVALSWYYWAAIGAVVLLVLGYAVWEWRQELATLWMRLQSRFAKRSD